MKNRSKSTQETPQQQEQQPQQQNKSSEKLSKKLLKLWDWAKKADTTLYQTHLTNTLYMPRENIPQELREQFRTGMDFTRSRKPPKKQPKKRPSIKAKAKQNLTPRVMLDEGPRLMISTVRSVNSISKLLGKGEVFHV